MKTENFRIITPILVTICLLLLGWIKMDVSSINDRLFTHLTNDEIHTPKSIVLTKAEFTIYQGLRQKQTDDMREAMCDKMTEIKNSLNVRIDNLRVSIDQIISMLGARSGRR